MVTAAKNVNVTIPTSPVFFIVSPLSQEKSKYCADVRDVVRAISVPSAHHFFYNFFFCLSAGVHNQDYRNCATAWHNFGACRV
jgi:hypothetical protein